MKAITTTITSIMIIGIFLKSYLFYHFTPSVHLRQPFNKFRVKQKAVLAIFVDWWRDNLLELKIKRLLSVSLEAVIFTKQPRF